MYVNNCEEEFTYHPTYGSGRIYSACKEKLNNPASCEFQLDVDVDINTWTIEITVTVSHDEPVTINIPPFNIYQKEDAGPGTYVGEIGKVTITGSDGNTRYTQTLDEVRHNALRPQLECSFNVNHSNVLGCDGSRSFPVVEYSDDEFQQGEEFTVEVRFPAIEDTVPSSTLRVTKEWPSYKVPLE